MSGHNRHFLRIGRALLHATRAKSGSWERNGKPLPWLSIQRWQDETLSGGSILIGAWCLSVMLDRDT